MNTRRGIFAVLVWWAILGGIALYPPFGLVLLGVVVLLITSLPFYGNYIHDSLVS